MTIAKALIIFCSFFLPITTWAGTLYTVDELPPALHKLDKGTGAATLVGLIHPTGDIEASVIGGAYDSSTETLFGTTFAATADSGLVRIDETSGLALLLANILIPRMFPARPMTH